MPLQWHDRSRGLFQAPICSYVEFEFYFTVFQYEPERRSDARTLGTASSLSRKQWKALEYYQWMVWFSQRYRNGQVHLVRGYMQCWWRNRWDWSVGKWSDWYSSSRIVLYSYLILGRSECQYFDRRYSSVSCWPHCNKIRLILGPSDSIVNYFQVRFCEVEFTPPNGHFDREEQRFTKTISRCQDLLFQLFTV